MPPIASSMLSVSWPIRRARLLQRKPDGNLLFGPPARALKISPGGTSDQLGIMDTAAMTA
jgi:hypothetical protein